MKLIYKLTPWILLAAIIAVLVISYFMNKSSYHVEGFSSGHDLGDKYFVGKTLTQIHDNIYFDEQNGNIMSVNEFGETEILTRAGSSLTITSEITHDPTMADVSNKELIFTVNTQNVWKDEDTVSPAWGGDEIKLDISNNQFFINGTSHSLTTTTDANGTTYTLDDNAGEKYIAKMNGDKNLELYAPADTAFATIVHTLTRQDPVKKYDVIYSGNGKNTTLHVFEYTSSSIKHTGSYAFSHHIDVNTCNPQQGHSQQCSTRKSSCPSGVGYTHPELGEQCCDCEVGKKSDSSSTDATLDLETVSNPLSPSSGEVNLAGIGGLKTSESLTTKKLIDGEKILFDHNFGYLLINTTLAGNSDKTFDIFYKTGEKVTTVNTTSENKLGETEKIEAFHKEIKDDNDDTIAVVFYTYFLNNVNITVIQKDSDQISLVTTRNFIITPPLPIQAAVDAANQNANQNVVVTSRTSASDALYNRIIDLVGRKIENEMTALLDPNANHDDNYILKTQIVPPVCPTCPNCENNCRGGGVCTDCGGQGGSGTRSESGSTLAKEESKKGPVSKVIDETGNVVEQTVDATGNLVSTTASAAGNLIKDTAGTAVDVLDDTVGDVARDVYGGARGVAGDVYGTTKNVAGEVYGTTKGLAGDAYSTTTGVAGDIYGTTSGILGDLYGGAKQLTQDVYGGVKNVGSVANASMQGNMQRAQQQQLQGGLPVQGNGANIGVTQRTAYTNTGISQPNVYNYYGALPEKQLNFIPITTDFSAFGR